MSENAKMIAQSWQGTLPDLLGIELIDATPERVTARMLVRPDLCTLGGVLHGGSVMAFADTLGAIATLRESSAECAHHDDRIKDKLPVRRRGGHPCHSASARRSIAAGPRWSGKPASRQRTASSSRWSRKRNSCCRPRAEPHYVRADARPDRAEDFLAGAVLATNCAMLLGVSIRGRLAFEALL